MWVAQLPGFTVGSDTDLVTSWLWTNQASLFTPLSLSFFICTMGLIRIPASDSPSERRRYDLVYVSHLAEASSRA